MKNIGNMLKEAQKLQTRMAEMQQRLSETEMEGAAGGGLVTVTLNGKGEMRRIKIDRSLADPNEMEMLEDWSSPPPTTRRRRSRRTSSRRCRRWPAACRCRKGSSCRSDGDRPDRAGGQAAGPAARARAALGPARALAMLKRPDTLMLPLAEALESCARAVGPCSTCGNLDATDPCRVCADPKRDPRTLCVVAEVEDLWAVERAAVFRGPLPRAGRHAPGARRGRPGAAGRRPAAAPGGGRGREEVILALAATVDGQTTSHYLAERLAPLGARVTRLAHGVPIGGELNYLDEGTLDAALRARQPVGA
jgi:recombination protein RecR